MKVLIIGAGIAGLCTGVYLRKSGFDTEIIEMHDIPGGLATAWERKGYTFETCVHWLLGSKEGELLHRQWQEIFPIEKLKFYEDETYHRWEYGDKTLTVYRNSDRTRRELLAKIPEDAAAIEELCLTVKKLSKFTFPLGMKFPQILSWVVKSIPYFIIMGKLNKITCGDYAQRFKNPLLTRLFKGELEDAASTVIFFSLAWMESGNAGYPIGGSLKMIGMIEDNYKKLGGQIQYEKKVEKIIVENGKAVGVRLTDGTEMKADIVISAADGHTTLYKMLEGKYLHPKHKKAYETYKPFPSYIQVSLGIDHHFKDEPTIMTLGLEKEMVIDPASKIDDFTVRIFHFDPSMAPAGKTSLVIFIPTYNDKYWVEFRQKNKRAYDREKKRIAQEIIAAIEKRFPAAKDKVEVADVSTPATVIRYTGNYRGSMEGWLPTPQTGFGELPNTVPGLKNFYMVGQWISPGGGLPVGPISGRALAQKICKENGIKFCP